MFRNLLSIYFRQTSLMGGIMGAGMGGFGGLKSMYDMGKPPHRSPYLLTCIGIPLGIYAGTIVGLLAAPYFPILGPMYYYREEIIGRGKEKLEYYFSKKN